MKMPQLYIRVGKDRFAPVDKPVKGEDTYAWDDKIKRIVLYKKADS